jgi:hypothetical protein
LLVSDPGIPDFEVIMEIRILHLPDVLDVVRGELPKSQKPGPPRPFGRLSKACCEAYGAGLIHGGREGVRAWEGDLEERFMAYKGAYENVHARPDFPLRVTGRGSVGWLFACYLFPGQDPDMRLVLLLNDLGSVTFQGLVEMVRL